MSLALSPHRRLAASWPHAEASRLVRVGSFTWHVQSFGERGPKLLFLHGTGASTHSWRDLVPQLEADFRILLLDLPGHAQTRSPAGFTPSLVNVAQAVAALLAAEGFEPDLAIGHSAGAAIAIELALRGAIEPEAILSFNGALLPFDGAASHLFPAMARLLFLNPVAPVFFSWRAANDRTVTRLIEGTGSHLTEEGLELYARLFRDPAHVRGALSLMARWDLHRLRTGLARLHVPLILIVGEKDKAVAPATADKVASLTEAARIERLPKLGHLAHEEDPSLASDLIRRIARDLELG